MYYSSECLKYPMSKNQICPKTECSAFGTKFYPFQIFIYKMVQLSSDFKHKNLSENWTMTNCPKSGGVSISDITVFCKLGQIRNFCYSFFGLNLKTNHSNSKKRGDQNYKMKHDSHSPQKDKYNQYPKSGTSLEVSFSLFKVKIF